MKQFQSFSTIAKETLLDSPTLNTNNKPNSNSSNNNNNNNNNETINTTSMKNAPTTTGKFDLNLDTVITNYNEKESFIEIDIINPKIHEPTNSNNNNNNTNSNSNTIVNKFTDYEIVTRTNLPQFPKRISHVRRRYSDFELFRHFLKREIQFNDRLNKVKIPHLPSKLIWQNRFDPAVIEQRRKDLEQWLRFVAGHPLIQTNCPTLIRFLQDQNFSA